MKATKEAHMERRSIFRSLSGSGGLPSLKTITEDDEEDSTMDLDALATAENEVWENLAYAICQREMGTEKYRRRLEKQNKRHSPGLGSKARLSYLTSKVKKTVASPGTGTQHYNAVGAMGYAAVTPDPRVPETNFFMPGKRFRVRLRHCAIRSEDDAASCQRQAALKFADQNEDGPFDLVLFTGRVALARNCKTFSEVITARGSDDIKTLCNKDPHYFFGLVDAIRRSPESYATLKYYSQLPYKLLSTDEKARMAKFRLVPANKYDMESGLLGTEAQHSPWELRPDRTNKKSQDYLRKEFAKRLENEPVKYVLQIQVHDLGSDNAKNDELWNPQRIWDEEDHPWMDLMNLIFTTPLPPTATNRTAFNIVSRPPCLVLEPAYSVWDYTSFHRACSTMYTTMELKNLNQINPDSKEFIRQIEKVQYLVILSTVHGKQGHPKVDVFITLSGTMGRTSPERLDRMLQGEDNDDGRDLYRIRVEPVGDILAVTIGARHRQMTSDWMLRYVTVADSDGSNVRLFPCHGIVLSKVTLRPGNVLLPHHEIHEVLRQERALETRDRQQAYRWRKIEGLPSIIRAHTVRDLPVHEQLLAEKYACLPWDLETTMNEMNRVGVKRTLPGGQLHQRTCLEEGMGGVVSRPSPTTSQSLPRRNNSTPGMVLRRTSMTARARKRWSKIKNVLHFITQASANIPHGPKGDMCRACIEDTDFGRLFTQGPNPLVIQRISRLPENLLLTDDMMEPFMQRELTFTEEMQAGRVYLADYEALHDQASMKSKNSNSCHQAAPLVLLYISSSGDLVPIAIQLNQQAGDDNPLFVPTDLVDDWLLAKLWVRFADFLLQVASHMFYCHLVVEPFVVATMRQLSSSHPVYKILKPHFRYILAGNTLIRTHVLRKGGALDRWTSLGSDGYTAVAKKLYSRFKMDDLDFTLDLKKRNIEVGDKLTNYYYREDGFRLWNAVSCYCEKLIYHFYQTDDDVVNDCEIQAWMKDIVDSGFPDNPDIGFPERLSTRKALSDLVCKVLFTTTCRHAATHTEAMDMYGHEAGVPARMKQPPPHAKAMGKKDLTVSTLPEQYPELYNAAIAYIMSMKKADSSALGQSLETYFVENEAKRAHDDFRKQLAFISKMIHKRNAELQTPYENLLPEKVPNSVEPLPFMPDAEPEMNGNFRRDEYDSRSSHTSPSIPLLTMPICMTFAKSFGGKSALGRRLSVNMFSRAMSSVNTERVNVPLNAIDGKNFGMHYNPMQYGNINSGQLN